MKATFYDLAAGIGVCHFIRDDKNYVAEVADRRILPQSVREVVAITHVDIAFDEEATTQDHVDRATLGLKRFRDRLGTFDLKWLDEDVDTDEWIKQAVAARGELTELIEEVAR